MNANDTGLERVRALLAADHRIAEKPMFGGIGFMLNGNMAIGFTKKGELMLRLGKDGERAAHEMPGAARMDFSHRMGGMLFIGEQAVADDADLRRWVDLAIGYVETLPAK